METPRGESDDGNPEAGLAEAAQNARERREEVGHFQCPYCNSYDVSRLFVATVNLDACECVTCGARWDEERGSGQYRGRASRSSVLMPGQ